MESGRIFLVDHNELLLELEVYNSSCSLCSNAGVLHSVKVRILSTTALDYKFCITPGDRIRLAGHLNARNFSESISWPSIIGHISLGQ